MHHDIEVLADPQAVARRAAEYVAEHARAALARQSRFTFAARVAHRRHPVRHHQRPTDH